MGSDQIQHQCTMKGTASTCPVKSTPTGGLVLKYVCRTIESMLTSPNLIHPEYVCHALLKISGTYIMLIWPLYYLKLNFTEGLLTKFPIAPTTPCSLFVVNSGRVVTGGPLQARDCDLTVIPGPSSCDSCVSRIRSRSVAVLEAKGLHGVGSGPVWNEWWSYTFVGSPIHWHTWKKEQWGEMATNDQPKPQGGQTMDTNVLTENISIWVWNKLKVSSLLVSNWNRNV